MIEPSYILRYSIGGVSRVQIWKSDRPLPIGYRLPWKIIRRNKKIRIEHESGKFCDVSEKIIREGTPVRLPPADSDSGDILVSVQEIPTLNPIYAERTPGSSGFKESWYAFLSSGYSVLESRLIDHHFVGVVRDRQGKTRKAFQLKKVEGGMRLDLYSSDLRIQGLTEDEKSSLLKGKGAILSPKQLALLEIQDGSFVWRFSSIDSNLAKVFEKAEKKIDPDIIWFQRSLKVSTAIIILFLLISWFVAKFITKNKVEAEVPQYAKIVFSKPKPKAPAPVEAKEVVPDSSPETGSPAPRKAEAPERSADVAKKAVSKSKTEKPKVSAAARKAKKIQNSMKQLLATKGLISNKSSRLADQMAKSNGSKVLNETSKGLLGSEAPKVNALGKQSAGVSLADAGTEGDASGVSYRSGQNRGATSKTGGGEFLSVGGGGGSPTLQGDGLSRAQVAKVINEHLSEIRACYKGAILRDPDVSGKIIVNFTIGASGKVTRSAIDSSSVGYPRLETCVVGRLKTWNFPKPRGGVNVGVVYPFIFRRL